MANRKMWMGPRGYEQWVPMPATGLDTSPSGYAGTESSFFNGGVGLHTSFASHKVYAPSWPANGRDDLRPISDMASGMFGDGPIFFIDPTAADKNVLPKQWSFPALAALDGPVLYGDARPSTVPTPANTLGYPAQSAQLTMVPGAYVTNMYQWSGNADASTTLWYINGVLTHTNLCTNPRAATLTGYSGEGSAETPTPTLSAGSPYPSITNTVRVTATMANTYLGVHYLTTGIVAGNVYSFACTMDSDSGVSGTYNIYVIWQTSTGSTVSVVDGATTFPSGSGGFVRVNFDNVTAPSGAQQAVVIMRKTASIAAGYFVAASAVTVVPEASSPGYFDGTMGTVTSQAAAAPPTSSSVYVPIPPGYTAWVGWHGTADGAGGVQVAPVSPGDSTGTPEVLTPLAVTDTTRCNTSYSSALYQGIEVSFTLGSATSIVLSGLMVQILPNGATPAVGGFISGQGHSGCAFASQPTMQTISTGIGADGLVSMAAKLTEIGDWT